MIPSLALLTRCRQRRVVFAVALALATTVAAAGRIVPPACARLGEDEVQCEQRYGFAKTGKNWEANDKLLPVLTGPGARTRTYLFEGWRIRVGFIDGVAACMVYSKDPAHPEYPMLRGEEVAAILAGESSPGQTWKNVAALGARDPQKLYLAAVGWLIAGLQAWVRPDGSVARVDTCQVTVKSPAALQRDPLYRREIERQKQASLPTF